MAKGSKQMMAEANAAIDRISVEEAQALLGDPSVIFLDVREGAELDRSGRIPGALHASRGFLEFKADPESPGHDLALERGKRVVVYCGSGARSTLAGKTLKDMGFGEAANLIGGFAAWRAAGAPIEGPEES
ncbi:MAG: rhodanese-like domain-containing protein [Geminicoccales bacterium]